MDWPFPLNENNIQKVIDKLKWMKEQKIWPNGLRYLWTDAHGVVLLLSLYKHLNDESYLQQAEDVVNDVKRVLGRKKGYRIGEEPDRDGQYFHYLTKWMYALNEFGKFKPQYKEEALKIAKDIHPHFFRPGMGVLWKMQEDLSGPYPGYGLGGLDAYDGYVVYRLIDEKALSKEISDMWSLIADDYHSFRCSQDLGLGEVLWMTHHFPNEDWARHLRTVAEANLDRMWVDVDKNRGYFRRDLRPTKMILAFSNFGVSTGIQSVGLWPERVQKLNNFFETFRSNDEYDLKAITHVMHCNSLFPGFFIHNRNIRMTTEKNECIPIESSTSSISSAMAMADTHQTPLTQGINDKTSLNQMNKT